MRCVVYSSRDAAKKLYSDGVDRTGACPVSSGVVNVGAVVSGGEWFGAPRPHPAAGLDLGAVGALAAAGAALVVVVLAFRSLGRALAWR